jgi:hypothetical protein
MVDRLKSSVHSLIERYVQRQSIVLDAMRDLRPDIILPLEAPVDPQTRTVLRRNYAQAPNKGRWGENQEWEYRLHGIGCHLIHTTTGEVIGWDVGSLKCFDWTWLVDYIAWMLEVEKNAPEAEVIRTELQISVIDVMELRNDILPILQQLEAEGILRAERENRYTLIKHVEASSQV